MKVKKSGTYLECLQAKVRKGNHGDPLVKLEAARQAGGNSMKDLPNQN